MPHYTSANDEAFISRITFDFVAQLEHRLETSGSSQSELAQKLDVSESAVSQVLNCNRPNLNLRTMVKYAHALGMKVAIVAYDDCDPRNENGPIGSEIFTQSWEKIGKPRDVWSVNEASYATKQYLHTVHYWTYGWANPTFSAVYGTIGELPHITKFVPQSENVTLSHA